jgi:circadian clock protein KaiC
MRGTTLLLTSLTVGGSELEQSEVGISSLVDTWLLLQIVRAGGERNRTLTIVKSRGMAHSNQASEYRLGARGIELLDTYLGADGVLTGSARVAREAEDAATQLAATEEIQQKAQERERRRNALERQVAQLREQFEADDAALERAIREAALLRDELLARRTTMAASRHAFSPDSKANGAARRRKERRP